MTLDDDTVDEAKDLADLSEGFTGEAPAKPDKAAAAATAAQQPAPVDPPPAEVIPKPRHRRITDDEYTRLSEAADKVTSLERQQASAFGSIGNLQKLINALQAGTPKGGKFVIPEDAFAEMATDFPELAQQVRGSLEKALSGTTGSGNADADDTRFERLLAEHATKREVDALNDAYPEWRKIVGAVDIKTTQPDAANPFRKWLATKDATFQARINNSVSARVIERAIEQFQTETKAPAKAAPNVADTRRQQIAAAVQPKGDGAAPGASKTEDDEFNDGYKSR